MAVASFPGSPQKGGGEVWERGSKLITCTRECFYLHMRRSGLNLAPHQRDEGGDLPCVLGLSLGLCRGQERP